MALVAGTPSRTASFAPSTTATTSFLTTARPKVKVFGRGFASPDCEASKALTTVFTPPADCSLSWALNSGPHNVTTLWQDLGTAWRSCFPPEYDTGCAPQGLSEIAGWNYKPGIYPTFSPGVCPHGYATALVTFDPTATHSQVACCPRYFSPPFRK